MYMCISGPACHIWLQSAVQNLWSVLGPPHMLVCAAWETWFGLVGVAEGRGFVVGVGVVQQAEQVCHGLALRLRH